MSSEWSLLKFVYEEIKESQRGSIGGIVIEELEYFWFIQKF